MNYVDKFCDRHIALNSDHEIHRRIFMKLLLGGLTGLAAPWSLAIPDNKKLTDCFVINGWIIPKHMLSGS